MGARGPKPGTVTKTGGRQKGTPNKRTKELAAAAEEAARKIEAALGAESFTGDSHALLMAVYKDESRPIELRLEAAKAAIAYEKPRLNAIDHRGEMNLNHTHRQEAAEEIARRLDRIAATTTGEQLH